MERRNDPMSRRGPRGARSSPRAEGELEGEALEQDEWPAEAHPWRDDLARVQRPPRGRLMDLVYERLATELGTTPAAAKRLVFPGPRLAPRWGTPRRER